MVAVVYGSNYGSTEKYAKWVAEELGADLITKPRLENLLKHDTIIYGGGLYAGGIKGASLISKNFEQLKDKNLFVFTVGLASTKDTSIFTPIINKNFSTDMINKIKFFHFRGGINYKKLNFIHKRMMAMMMKMTAKKENQTDEDKLMLETYGKEIDFSDKSYIKPLIDAIRG